MATDFRDLKVWDEAMGLVEMIYEMTSRFPDDERYGLVSQMRRAGVERATSVSFLLQSLRKALNAKLRRNAHSPFPIPHSPR